MAWTTYQIGLAVMMLFTGSLNTLSAKWADITKAPDCKGKVYVFDHPFLQAVGMFLGEFLCLVTFKLIYCIAQRRGTTGENQFVQGSQEFSPFVFLPPALLDMCGTSIMYIGLNLTYASSFQMLRGAVMIFTGLLSVAFLGKKMTLYHWLGMLVVVAGLAIVGVSDIVFGDNSKADMNGIISGDLLIIMAQIIAAAQMVYEEKFVTKYNVPALQAVGWEGFFGFCTLGFLLIPFYYINAGSFAPNDPEHRLENAPGAMCQLANSWVIAFATFGNVLSIAFFNFSGISVTKELSATTRMVLDSGRTLVIWVVSLSIQWQKFQYLQVVGFVLLVFGMCIYNDILFRPLINKMRNRGPSLTETDAPTYGTSSASINRDKERLVYE